MKSWAQFVAPFFLLLNTSAARADDILLVKGRIAAAEYLDGLMAAPLIGNAQFVEGGNYRVQLAIEDVLIGQETRPDLYMTLTITGAPAGNPHPEIFLFAEQLANGQLQSIDWDYADKGLCIGDTAALAYGMEKELSAARNKYPCLNPNP